MNRLEACLLAGITAVLTVIVTVGVISVLQHDPDIETLDCYLDRSYQPVRVVLVGKDTLLLKPQKVSVPSDPNTGWFLYDDDESGHRLRDKKFVMKNYSKVSCDNWIVRE